MSLTWSSKASRSASRRFSSRSCRSRSTLMIYNLTLSYVLVLLQYYWCIIRSSSVKRLQRETAPVGLILPPLAFPPAFQVFRQVRPGRLRFVHGSDYARLPFVAAGVINPKIKKQIKF